MNAQQIIEVLSQVNHVNYHGDYIEYVIGDEIDHTSYLFQKGVNDNRYIGSVQHGFSVGWIFDIETDDLSKVLI